MLLLIHYSYQYGGALCRGVARSPRTGRLLRSYAVEEKAMNTSQLECFVQVASNLNFRRAADELHLSQPTVSKQVAALEAELGGDLFVRTTRSVALTALGQSFLPDAQEILRLTYAAAARARRRIEGTELTIGYSDPNDLHRLAPVLGALHRERPEVRVAFVQGPRDANIERLTREQLDLVLGFETTSLEVGGIAFEPLRNDTLVCVVRDDSPLALLDEVGQEDVDGLPQIVCLPMGLRRRGYTAQQAIPRTDEQHTVFCATTTEALCLVDAGFGYALLPAISAVPLKGHRVLPWRGSTRASYGTYLRSEGTSALCRRFLSVAREVYG